MGERQILVTGGTGYIGSHTCVALIQQGYKPVIVDNLSNSKEPVLDRIALITNYRPPFYRCDLRDSDNLDIILSKHHIDSVIHFAGLKAVAESVEQPLRYYDNNIGGSLVLIRLLQKRGIKRLLFSSSATVYGVPDSVPIAESAPMRPTNPYGYTKATVERILRDTHSADSNWRIGILRYFNPVGAHESGLIGEDPSDIPNNLMPFVCQVASHRRNRLRIFGADYPTQDGTGIRDYIHVMDLAEAHVAGLHRINSNDGLFIVNVGTGSGFSVLDLIRTFERVSKRSVPYTVDRRRPGDVAVCFADVRSAYDHLGWRAKRTIEDMCIDAWRWQLHNPNGYQGSQSVETILGGGSRISSTTCK